MDIITKGDFSISNFNGLTTLSFRCPSQEKIDFVSIINKASAIGRNEPCPCGSGKKYKKCHGA